MAHGAPDHRLVIDLVELVKLINKIETIDAITAIANITNIDSIDLVDRITRIDAIDSLGEITIAKVVPLVSPPVLLLDQFDSGLLKWESAGPGHLEPSSERAFSGSGSMKIHTGPYSGATHYAKRRFAVSEDLTMRASLRFTLPPSNATHFILYLARYTPTKTMQGHIWYLLADKKWQYRSGQETYDDIPGGAQDLKLGHDIWHQLQLECDFSTGKFVGLKIDALSMDMSTLDLYDGMDPDTEHASLDVGICAGGIYIVDTYVDDCYVEAW